MSDVVGVAVMAGLFAVALAYVNGCMRLKGGAK
jgi:hypothetical protein